jgi:hypothetical protein
MKAILAIMAAAMLAGCTLTGCGTPDIERYPGGTDQPYSTTNNVPIHLPQEV